MSDKLIPPRLCRECREAFTPRKSEQMYCPKPARCAYQAQSRQRRGHVPIAAVEGKRRRDAEMRAAKLDGRFGTLSAREQEIFAFAHRVGYDEGYAIAYAPFKKSGSRRRTDAA